MKLFNRMILCLCALLMLSSCDDDNNDEKKTLAYVLAQITATGLSRAGVSAAISVVMMSVPIAVFIFSQSQVMETMATSGMKD